LKAEFSKRNLILSAAVSASYSVIEKSYEIEFIAKY
jgi:hypothetical protein